MDLNWKEIGTRIRELRHTNNLTIERLCEMIDVSTSFIGLVERGDSGISIEKLYKLSQVFNVSIDYIVKGTDDITTSKMYSKFDKLNSTIFDYTDDEIKFLIELTKFLKPRISVNND